MKAFLVLVIVVLQFSISLVGYTQNTPNTCKITYLANEGFLLQTANHKVLVDALFGGIKGNWCEQPNDSISNLMLKGIAPFDNIDVVLVTHKHSDHFKANMVIDFLMNNQKSILICPDQVDQLMKNSTDYSMVSSRIQSQKALNPWDTLLEVKEFNVRVLPLNHGAYFETDSTTGNKYDIHSGVVNFGYVIEIDGFKILHTGDGSPSTNKDLYKSYGLDKSELDLALLDRVFLSREGQELMSETIHSKNIVFMHIEPGKGEFFRSVVKSVPEMMVFVKPMENIVIKK